MWKCLNAKIVCSNTPHSKWINDFCCEVTKCYKSGYKNFFWHINHIVFQFLIRLWSNRFISIINFDNTFCLTSALKMITNSILLYNFKRYGIFNLNMVIQFHYTFFSLWFENQLPLISHIAFIVEFKHQTLCQMFHRFVFKTNQDKQCFRIMFYWSLF